MQDRQHSHVRETARQYAGQESRLTYRDYLQLPPGPRYELLGGEVLVMDSPSTLHQTILMRLAHALYTQLECAGKGRVFVAPLDIVLSEHDVVQPDLIWVAQDRLSLIEDQCIRGAPSLVVEVLSPSTEQRDREPKRELYGRAGVREYWLIDAQAGTLDVAVLDGGRLVTRGCYSEDDTVHMVLAPEVVVGLGTVLRRPAPAPSSC